MKLLRSERGATITETAFILPVLILFLMIIMEGGRVLSSWMVLTNSTREAARWIVVGQQQAGAQSVCISNSVINWTCVQTTLTGQVQTYEQALIGNMLNPAALVVTPTFGTDSSGAVTSATISATYTLHTLTPMMQKLVPTFNVFTTATMRAES